jgi:hypothetical protein
MSFEADISCLGGGLLQAAWVDSMNRDHHLTPAEANRRPTHLWLAAGVFLVVLASYVLANPGRIDLIDGQIRYEISLNWLTTGRPILIGPTLVGQAGSTGNGGFRYSYYGAGASVAAMPLVWLGTFYDDPPGEATRFMFSLTCSLFGGLAATLLFLFYVELGVRVKEALIWTAITTFATLMWPASDSSFDNAQHACLLSASVFVGFLSAKRRSSYLAVLGGLVAGLLFTYQEYFALVFPVLALSTIDWNSWRQADGADGPAVLARALRLLNKFDAGAAFREFKTPTGLSPEGVRAFHHACLRYTLFLLATLVGVALALDYNHLRFGSAFVNGAIRYGVHRSYPPMFGNPLVGLLTLVASPGKSILFYSPPIILGFVGLRRLWTREPQVGFVIVGSSVILLLFISTMAFPGGDWCWGPRYLVPLVPLWALAFPFVPFKEGSRRYLLAGIVGIGLVVQCLAVSVENQRFFFERGLPDFFWADDPWFYFKHSALAARPGEALSLLKGPPRSAVSFNTDNSPPTYTVLGTPKDVARAQAPRWMRQYRVFYVPKPWPLWMWDIPPDQRALNLPAWLVGVLGAGLLGFALVCRALQKSVMGGTADYVPAEEKAVSLGPR